MRAVVIDRFGGPDVLAVRGWPDPTPLPTEVRVRTAGAGVNPVDWKTRSGAGMAAVVGEPPLVLGWEFAGIVDAVGLGVTRFSVGDRVYGFAHFPRPASAYAEFVTAPSRQLATAPESVDLLQSSGLALAGLTALQILDDVADVGPGDRVLVHAAAGGVGHLAVQIAKARGAYVIGTASAPKHDLLRELGADEMIDYRAADFTESVAEVDVVVDLVGGDNSLRSLDVLAPDGLLVSVPSRLPEGLAEAAHAQGKRFTGMLVEPDYAGLATLAAMVDADDLRVLVDAVVPFDEAPRAHELGERGGTTGKIILVP
jgi:NADPH:quinone reductase-like Zn-dependent oxidoreductase